MTKQDFEILINSLYGNNQLFIPQGQNIKEWIDNAFVEKQEEAINVIQCCKSDSEQLRAFASYLSDEWNCPDIDDEIIEDYIKSS